jgi:hypothetical protein
MRSSLTSREARVRTHAVHTVPAHNETLTSSFTVALPPDRSHRARPPRRPASSTRRSSSPRRPPTRPSRSSSYRRSWPGSRSSASWAAFFLTLQTRQRLFQLGAFGLVENRRTRGHEVPQRSLLGIGFCDPGGQALVGVPVREQRGGGACAWPACLKPTGWARRSAPAGAALTPRLRPTASAAAG